MAGDMGGFESFSIKKCSERIEVARKNGAKYFLISFPQTKNRLALMKDFAKEVMPSYK